MAKRAKICRVNGCEDNHYAKGYCRRHYAQIKAEGKIYLIGHSAPSKRRHCDVDGCENPHTANGYCSAHYEQFKKYGYILRRTRHTPNSYLIHEPIVAINLFGMRNEKVGETLIDIEDLPLIKTRKWCLENGNYVVSTNNSRIYLHRFIMNANSKQKVDHKNGNGLDNRRRNLRICTHRQNSYNARLSKNNTSGAKNVHWSNAHNRWIVKLTFNGIRKYIGCFQELNAAKMAARDAQLRYHEGFASCRRRSWAG